MIQFHQFQKSFNGISVLELPNVTLSKGIYWLKGENGSGKTTLLKCMAGLLPFDGTISVEDISIRQRMAYKKKVNFAEAEPVYPSFLTGVDLVHFYLNTKGGSKAQAEQLVHQFGITYLQKKVGTYSDGMTKKLSLLLSFIGAPKLILLDEPLITLDTTAAKNLQELIQQHHQSGVGFIMTSHQPFAASLQLLVLHLQNKNIQTE